MKLVYTGSLEICGIVGPWTNTRYRVVNGEPFEVDDEQDAKRLLDKWPNSLSEVKESKPSRAAKKESTHDDSPDVQTLPEIEKT